MVVGRVRVPLGASHVPQRTADPGLLGPSPDMRAMAGPGGGANPGQVGSTATGCATRVVEGINPTMPPPNPPQSIPDLDLLLLHFWEAPRVSVPRVSPSFGWWEGKAGGDRRSFAQVAASPPRASPLAPLTDRFAENRGLRLDGFGAGLAGQGVGRFGWELGVVAVEAAATWC